MTEAIEDRNLLDIEALSPPTGVKREIPMTEGASQTVLAGRRAIRDVMKGRRQSELVVIAGPCSIHDTSSALEYARRLRRLAEDVREELVVVMRTYFEKPRTTTGWKGLINDPALDGSYRADEGVRLARQLLLEINEMGLPCGGEFLDPFTPQYIGDLLSWSSIGARTSESQVHRQLASGLSMPVGFKNGTDGRLETARDAIVASRHSHAFFGIDSQGRAALVTTLGNPDGHIVLRGGRSGPNFEALHVERAADLSGIEDLARPVLVDCSHANSAKDHRRQAAVCRSVLASLSSGPRPLLGLMLESHLHEGSQDWRPGQPMRAGVSITDACIGWEETETVVREIAQAVKVTR